MKLRHVFQKPLETKHIPRVMLRRTRPWIVHDAHMHDGIDVAAAKDVPHFFSTQVHGEVLYIFREG